MTDLSDNLSEAVEKARESRLNAAVAACVAVVATFMALCNVKDGNIVQAMAQAQTQAVDEWAYYQAKSTKENLAESMADQLALQRDLTSIPEARAKLEKKVTDYKSKASRYSVEKQEIKKKAEAHEKTYDDLNLHDDQFDISEACLSIAIALLGVTALTQKRWLFGLSLGFAGFGVLLGLAGFAGWAFHPDWIARILT
jgi:primase-polymerase (primpol)-like protein